MNHATTSPSKTATNIPTASPIVALLESLFDYEFILLGCVLGDGNCRPVVGAGVARAIVALSGLCHRIGTLSPIMEDADVAVL
jgi:hypothetical protein